jgi:protein SCO1
MEMRIRARLRPGAVLTLLAVLVALGPTAWAHEAAIEELGFDEKLGAFVPLDAGFTAEDGTKIALAELVVRPSILVLGYYRCKDKCNELYTGLARALRGVEAAPGKDYQVICVSINEAETPADALREKGIALASIEGPFPATAWRFLVGDEANIDRLSDATGFVYRRNGEDFDHPLGLIVLAPDGKIVRYIYGTEFLPVDISMSLLEASSGLVRPTVAKLLRLCFSYDPAKKQLSFDLLRVSAFAVTALVLALVLYLALSGRRRSGKERTR